MPLGVEPGNVRVCRSDLPFDCTTYVLPKNFEVVMVCLVLCRMALSVQLYLKIDRVDQAEKQLKVCSFLMIANTGCRLTRTLFDILIDAVLYRPCPPWMMMPH